MHSSKTSTEKDHRVLVLNGDGIGPEVMTETLRALDVLKRRHALRLEWETALIGGAAIDATGGPLPAETVAKAKAADAVLLAAVGGPKWDKIEWSLRPERGLLGIRSALGLFANLRPAVLYPQLASASSLKAELVAGLDVMIVRELTGDVYFGQPRGVRTQNGEREAFNTMIYRESEIERILKVGFELARKRGRRLCSVDKANVLEVSGLWRETAERLGRQYPDVALSHMYVDNAAMQLVRQPKQFDVLVTGNLFGDILSDEASMLTGSIGLLPSASLDSAGKGLYEPIHGSAPDIAGRGVANPLATILSAAMMLRYSFNRPDLAVKMEQAVSMVLDRGYRTADIYTEGHRRVGTREMGDAVCDALETL
jgi:3-isopropylmalate dehydrogenase